MEKIKKRWKKTNNRGKREVSFQVGKTWARKEKRGDCHLFLGEEAKSGEKKGWKESKGGRVFRRWNPLAFPWFGFLDFF